MTDIVTGCAKTPLSDLLRRIPQEAVYNWTNPEEGRELWRLGSESAPIGRLAHEAADALDAMLAASPQGEGPSGEAAAGCAESEVGRAVYERIETLMGGDSAELDYLADLVSSVEEYGSWSGPTNPFDAPIKPSTDTGELRERVAASIGSAWAHGTHGKPFDVKAETDAILDLIQSERGSL